ncbi:ChbG/HpnK family deacetylase [Inquilinus sp. Marseille-Q2685]|uniref:ChbG/HpnK family deacetylase n=1 Tax=Inquilinus sp. Marseille-Q2685 TaxID=2866581 RepID=UPI001CE44937|nr:ChbG/HpnK family deacetylase [Inquilinus sp. Marseille-Q2685]
MPSRRITLVADDYGLAPGVSLAIRQLLAEGRLSGTSCLTVGRFWMEAAGPLRDLAASAGSIEIGLHLCLTGPFAPLSPQLRVDAGWRRFPTLAALIRLSLSRRLPPGALSAEIEAQHAAFAAAFGRPPDFIDGHQHVHLLPGVAETLALTLRSAGLRPRWIRRCGDRPRRILRRPFAAKSLALQALSLRSDAVLAGVAGRRNDSFCGIYDFVDRGYGVLFERWLETAPDRAVIMCHPGLVDARLAALDPVTGMRAVEYRYFAGPDFPAALRRHGAALAPFGAPAAANGPAPAAEAPLRREIG